MSTSSPTTAPGAGRGDDPRPPSARVVHVVVAAVGAVALVGAGASAAAGTVGGALRQDTVLTADAAGVTAVDVDVAAAEVRVVTGAPGTEVGLDVRGARGDWLLDRDGGTLVVSSPPRSSGWGLGWVGARGEGVATLTLPSDLARGVPDAEVDVAGGAVDVDGTFGTLRVGATGGAVDLTGSVADLVVEVTGGGVDAALQDVATADVRTTAGSAVVSLDGTPPDAVAVDATAGSVDLTLPPATYDVRADAAAGGVDDRLRSSATSPRTVDVTLSAGSATLREQGSR